MNINLFGSGQEDIGGHNVRERLSQIANDAHKAAAVAEIDHRRDIDAVILAALLSFEGRAVDRVGSRGSELQTYLQAYIKAATGRTIADPVVVLEDAKRTLSPVVTGRL